MSKSCGLYRATVALPAAGPAPLLVYYHLHVEGLGYVLKPHHNVANRWHFSNEELPATKDVVEGLVRLKPEGLYRFCRHFHPDDERIVAENALVQLGYNATAEPIVFFPEHDEKANQLRFPSQGMKIGEKVYDLLEPLDVSGPRRSRSLH
jgi:hypothetical protein